MHMERISDPLLARGKHSLGRRCTDWPTGASSLATAAGILLYGIWAAAVWALFGAAICRIGRGEAGRRRAGRLRRWRLRFAWRKWPSYFAAPLLPVGGVLLPCPLPDARLDDAARCCLFLGAFVWPLVLVAGFVMALLLVGVLFGWPLMWGTISAEGSDSFDALSRPTLNLPAAAATTCSTPSWPARSAGSAGCWSASSPPA